MVYLSIDDWDGEGVVTLRETPPESGLSVTLYTYEPTPDVPTVTTRCGKSVYLISAAWAHMQPESDGLRVTFLEDEGSADSTTLHLEWERMHYLDEAKKGGQPQPFMPQPGSGLLFFDDAPPGCTSISSKLITPERDTVFYYYTVPAPLPRKGRSK